MIRPTAQVTTSRTKRSPLFALTLQRDFLCRAVLYCTLLDINKPVLSILSVGVLYNNLSPTSAEDGSTLHSSSDSTKRDGEASTACLRKNSVGCRLIDFNIDFFLRPSGHDETACPELTIAASRTSYDRK